MDRGFFTVEEAAVFLGKKVSTMKKWLQTGKAVASLNMIHGGRIQRVVKATEVDRLLALEVPDVGSRPGSRQQWLWDHHKWKGGKKPGNGGKP